ncbi:DUF6355 family natural product biosynthesis protein [Streptomyces sp. DB-54]
MLKTTKRVLALCTAGLALAGAMATTAVAAPVHTGRQVQPGTAAPNDVCGFYKTKETAWYNHCQDRCIVILVDPTGWGSSWERIIPQRELVDIGGADDINFAKFERAC